MRRNGCVTTWPRSVPAPRAESRSSRWRSRRRSPDRARSWCAWRSAASAARTCTWPRATCRRGAAGVVPGHEVVGRVVDAGAGAERFGPGERVGVAWLRRTCGACRFCARGAREPLPGPASSPAGTPTAATPSTRSCPRPSPTALPDERPGARGWRRCCAPGSSATAPARRSACQPGRAARALRLRRLGPRHDPDRASTGLRGLRLHPRRRRTASSPASSAPPRWAGSFDPPPEPAGRRDPVRAGRRAGAAGAGGAGPRRHPRRGRHPPVRHPAAGLPAPPVPGARAAQRHRQHPGGRRGAAAPGRRDPDPHAHRRLSARARPTGRSWT